MNFLYILLLPVLSVLLALRFPQGFLSRLSPTLCLDKCYWLHCASLGEVTAIEPLISQLKQKIDKPIVLSVFTPSGYKRAQRISGISVIYLPLDFKIVVRRFLSQLNPEIVIIMETEIWPNLLNECQRQHIKCCLINARISAQSFKRYRLLPVIKKSLRAFVHIICQSEQDRVHFIALGVNHSHISVMGNLKFDVSIPAEVADKITIIKKQYPWSKRPVFLAASVREGEENDLFAMFQTLYAKMPEALFMIAPRHQEQFDEVERIARRHQLAYARRSKGEVTGEEAVFIIDTLGELMAFYALADVVFVGGSLKKYGGHNMIEPALFNVAMIVGPHTEHFADVMRLFLAQDAIIQAQNSTEITTQLIDLMTNAHKRQYYSKRAYQVLVDNRGQTERLVAMLLAH